MELSLPNFQSLEKRIKQLSEELSIIRSRTPSGGESVVIPDETREKIISKIENLLEILDEF
ncbi:MAG: hypothetical protein CMF77_03590 [Candidatus Marinimicrobia bacterium]|jgi:hypothetical protein|nr:hypothetical protein [Candidatus Neomarinimicrobiota bacterium]|tara:strand:- start:1285 stop:1467 length:183 start_codon:yes stop_codon:yes gene_type:complete